MRIRTTRLFIGIVEFEYIIQSLTITCFYKKFI